MQLLATDDCGVAAPDGALFALDDDLAFTVNYGPVLVAVEVALIADAFACLHNKFFGEHAHSVGKSALVQHVEFTPLSFFIL